MHIYTVHTHIYMFDCLIHKDNGGFRFSFRMKIVNSTSLFLSSLANHHHIPLCGSSFLY